MIEINLEVKIRKLEENTLDIERKISNIIEHINYVKNNSGEIFDVPPYQILVTPNFQYYKLIKQENGRITKNIPKKREREKIKNQIKKHIKRKKT